MTKKSPKKPAKKASAPKSKRDLKPQRELTDEELSRASGGTLAWSAPLSMKVDTESPVVVNSALKKVDEATLWLLKK